MAARPLTETAPLPPSAVLATLHRPDEKRPELDLAVPHQGAARRFSVYAPMAAFDLITELRHLSNRAIEGNVFFDPRFLVPAMPRLDERRVRLMVIRDEDEARSRLRLLMPFSVERAGMVGGPQTIRAWTHPFGPLGTLPLDGDDPAGTLTSLLETLARRELKLPRILVLPDLRIDGPMARTLVAAAEQLGLPVTEVNAFTRASLTKVGPASYLRQTSLSKRRRRELARQRRLLERQGTVRFEVARDPDGVRLAFEDFLALEASGWKGRERSALTMDRYRSAFARESVNALAEDGRARVFTLRLDGQAVASLVVFIDRGEAYAWKSAYDEAFSNASPGQQLVAEATRSLVADPAVKRADSCAMPDHFVMNRFWKDRVSIATLVVGLDPDSHKAVAKAAKGLVAARRSRNVVRLMRERLASLLPSR
ncbi:GNAT family N-acetyltransferase [Aurantimonas aggregata]|uniref:GNAT family N-acetyltransferase n=1 Tax=Aurantimonas aggregata TaxID=2047720 RepID=A0A6L9MHV4_9HYPH|nr:GNAT family N-acetyltransferase [Aurantimonas aggregata]NDV87385.1 GNAT family N-acetyltransferase [Aurantimonas aggregata]